MIENIEKLRRSKRERERERERERGRERERERNRDITDRSTPKLIEKNREK